MAHCAGRTMLPPLLCFFLFYFLYFLFFFSGSLCLLSLSLLVSVLCFFFFFVCVCSPVFLFWPVRLLCSWFYILSPSVLRWRDKDDGGVDPRLCVVPLLFSPSLFRCFFFLCYSPFSVAFSGFYKAREWPLFTCSCLTIVRHERLCFFEKKQGQKICPPLCLFFRTLLLVFLPCSRSLSLSLFFFLCFCFVCFSLSPAGSLPHSAFFLSFSVSPGFFLPPFSSLFLCFYRAWPVVTDGMQRNDNH